MRKMGCGGKRKDRGRERERRVMMMRKREFKYGLLKYGLQDVNKSLAGIWVKQA